MRTVRILLLVLLATALTGCVSWREGDHYGRSELYGQAVLAVDGFPIYGADVQLSGKAYSKTTTSRNGTFSFRRLPEGDYHASLHALHGSYTTNVWVKDGATLNWRVEPRGVDRQLFHALSGLKRYYVDRSGLTWDYGPLVRWENRVINVFMDVQSAPSGLDPSLPDRYWREVRRWNDILKGRYTFRRVDRSHDADITVTWVPRGYLGDQAGIARHVAFYENGALKKVEIEIDIAYADWAGVWEHEWAHAMGVNHSTDPRSVMYPWLTSSQRTTFSSHEIAHLRLMYDIPSGRRLSQYGVLVAEGFEPVDLDDAPMVEEAPVTGQRGHVRTLEGEFIPWGLDQF